MHRFSLARASLVVSILGSSGACTSVTEPTASEQAATASPNGSSTLDVRTCNSSLFGTPSPRYLEPRWAQNFIGSGLLRDTLLTPEEAKTPLEVSIAGEEEPSPAFRNQYPAGSANWGTAATSTRVPDGPGLADHAHGTISLLVGPWRSSVMASPLATFLYTNHPSGHISSGQGTSCWDGTDKGSSTTLFFGSAGNDWGSWVGEHYDKKPSLERVVCVASADPLGFSSLFNTVGSKPDLLAAYSDMATLQVMDQYPFGGTSGASPIAAAVGSYVYKVVASRLDARHIKALLMATADPPRSDDPNAKRLGYGTVNIPRALAVARYVRNQPSSLAELQAPSDASTVQFVERAAAADRPALKSYATIKASARDCTTYEKEIQHLYRSALLEAPTKHEQKKELAAFYREHDLSVSAHRFLQTPMQEFAKELRSVWDDTTASVALRGFALLRLAKSDAFQKSELEKIVQTPSTDPFLVGMAAKALAFRNELSKAICQRAGEVAKAVELKENPGSMTAAFWGSGINQPLYASCSDQFGRPW